MSNTLNPHKTGLALGALLGGLHFMWSILVALGWAQPVFDWSLSLHMMQLPVTVLPFSASSAVGLLIVTSVVGYVVGWVFATVWNAIHQR